MSILQVLTFLSCMFLFDQKPKLLFISLFFHFCSCTKYCLQYLHTVLYQLSPGYYTHQTLLSYVQLASQQAKQSSHVYEYVCKAVWVWNTLKSAGFFTDNLWFGYWLTISSRVARASRTGRQSHLQYWRRERHKRKENTSHRNITNKIGPCVCLFVPLLRTIFMSRTQFQRFMCCIKKESLQFSDDGVEECPRAPEHSGCLWCLMAVLMWVHRGLSLFSTTQSPSVASPCLSPTSSVRVLLLLLASKTGQPSTQQHGSRCPGPGAVIRPADLAGTCGDKEGMITFNHFVYLCVRFSQDKAVLHNLRWMGRFMSTT